ncbi:hypothetical protein MRB53_009239 [Persea americana]|uniref:Uncharacterized protein n=1 Tax=Persea americana TaxID=3435 RepID=A0ACC2LNK8_PERAE|nr:hypothetical protein MRB53_009239 [Persea americana]
MNGHPGEEQALKVTHEDNTSRGRGRGVFRGRGRGRGRQPFNKATIECFQCHKLGHFQYEYPSWEKGANYAKLDEGEELLLMSYVELNHAKREEVCFLDSGCSNHMSGNKEWFSDLDVQFRQTVKLGDNSRMAVVGKGNVRTQVNGITQANKGWNWDMSREEMALDVLEWGDSEEEDDEAENEGELGVEVNENEEAGSNGTNGAGSSGTSSPSRESHDENFSGPVERRARRVSLWMQDYETGEGLSEEEDLNAMMILTEADPITFEEAVKSKKWRDAMNAEI